jgi:hypothetical protein
MWVTEFWKDWKTCENGTDMYCARRVTDGLTEYWPGYWEDDDRDDRKWGKGSWDGYVAEEFNMWRLSKPETVASGNR